MVRRQCLIDFGVSWIKLLPKHTHLRRCEDSLIDFGVSWDKTSAKTHSFKRVQRQSLIDFGVSWDDTCLRVCKDTELKKFSLKYPQRQHCILRARGWIKECENRATFATVFCVISNVCLNLLIAHLPHRFWPERNVSQTFKKEYYESETVK